MAFTADLNAAREQKLGVEIKKIWGNQNWWICSIYTLPFLQGKIFSSGLMPRFSQHLVLNISAGKCAAYTHTLWRLIIVKINRPGRWGGTMPRRCGEQENPASRRRTRTSPGWRPGRWLRGWRAMRGGASRAAIWVCWRSRHHLEGKNIFFPLRLTFEPR